MLRPRTEKKFRQSSDRLPRPVGMLVMGALSMLWSCAAIGQNATPRVETWMPNGPVNAIVQNGGTVYIGGTFDWIAPYAGSGAAIDRASGEMADSFSRINGAVYACVPDGDSGWFVGGDFDRAGIHAKSRIAHILPDGAVDKHWNAAVDGAILALALSPDGSALYIGGNFTSVAESARSRLAALDAATGALRPWNPGANAAVRALAVSPDGGTVYTGGSFTYIDGQTRYRIAAVDTATGKPLAWNPGANGTVHAIALSADGTTVYAGGDFTTAAGAARSRIAAIASATGIATDWNPGADDVVYTLSAAGTAIYAGGDFTGMGNVAVNRVARILADGTVDRLWNPTANKTVYALVASDVCVYAAGYFTSIGGAYRNRLAALDTTVGNATAWNPNANGTVRALALSDTDVYAGGSLTTLGGVARSNIAALDVNTGKATDWNPDADGTVHALAVSGSGLFVGGAFSRIGGRDRDALAVLDLQEGLAASWQAGINVVGTVYALAVSAVDGRLYVGGQYIYFNGSEWPYYYEGLCAVDLATGEPADWNPHAHYAVLSVGLAGNMVYAGGYFTELGGQERGYAGAVNMSTGLATPWNPGASRYGYVETLAISGDTVYACGHFTSIGGQPRSYIAALDAYTGDALPAWHPDADNKVYAVALSADKQKVYAGGDFTSIGGAYRDHLAALDTVGGDATVWNPGANDYVNTLVVSGTTVYAGGKFTRIGGQNMGYFAQFDAPVPPSNPGSGEITTDGITWTWQDNSSDETGFNVWVDSGPSAPVTLRTTTGDDTRSWRQTGLDVNTQYTFQVAATNDGGEGAKTPPHSAWTLSSTPLALSADPSNVASLRFKIDTSDGNPAGTQYAIGCLTTGQWVQEDNTLGKNPVHRTAPAWLSAPVSVYGAVPSIYRFAARARNGAGVTTEMGPDSADIALTPVPNMAGELKETALAGIGLAGLVVGIVTERYSPTISAGTVISQSLPAGLQVFSGSSVSLVISKGQKAVVVPDVLGKTQYEATTTLGNAELLTGPVRLEYHPVVPQGLVLAQDPAGGTPYFAGASVSLVISRGPQPVAVPSLAGQTQDAALLLLTGSGLILGTVTQTYHDTLPAGIVVSHTPPAGAEVMPGSAVALVVSKGRQPLTVPNVVGETQSVAFSAIQAAGLTVGAVSEQHSDSVPSGKVISQNPAADTEVLPGSAVALVISKGPRPISVPDVVGQSQSAATATLVAAHLILGALTQAYSATVAVGMVVSQDPAPGSEVLSGTPVSLVVSKGPQPIPVPNVTGLTQSAAVTALSQAGLIAGAVTRRYNPVVEEGAVISQDPASGTLALPDSAVALVICDRSAQAAVPRVVGLSLAQATAAITAAGLSSGTITEKYSVSVPKGNVMEQSPAPDMLADPGTAVALVVSRGAARQVVVPNVTGMALAQAEASLAAAGLGKGTVSEQYNAVITAGNVMYQNPSAGANVALDTAVNLVVSRGPQPITVPDLSGLPVEQAQATLENAGLTVGTIAEAPSETVPAGSVISQDPPAGAQLTAGLPVNLTISSGPENAGCACPRTTDKRVSFERFRNLLGDLLLGGISLLGMRAISRLQ